MAHFLLFLISVCLSMASSALAPITLKPELITSEAHNGSWFTQGLYKDGEVMYVSSGLYGRSAVIAQGPRQQQQHSLEPSYFAEGLTVIGNKLYLLTWKENTLFIMDKTTLEPLSSLPYQGEGWGLTHNDDYLIMSNGSNQITFRDKESFAIQKTISINKLNYINELEYVDGIIWANRWYDDRLYAIDAEKGCILAKMDLQTLRQQAGNISHKNIANGVAYDPEHQGLWLTGKYWTKRFLVKLPALQTGQCP